MSEVIPANSNFTCGTEDLLSLHEKLYVYERVLEARDTVKNETGFATSYAEIHDNRCAWINHRLLGDCRPTCDPVVAAERDASRVTIYDTMFGCSGDMALCSNIQ